VSSRESEILAQEVDEERARLNLALSKKSVDLEAYFHREVFATDHGSPRSLGCFGQEKVELEEAFPRSDNRPPNSLVQANTAHL